MNRSARRHKSTKVPKVKLRPAPNKEADLTEDRRAEQEAWRHYTELKSKQASGKRKAVDEDDEKSDDENSEDEEDNECAPLAGCVICTTGFSEEKVRLQDCTSALGAVFEGNLTDAATHLVATTPGSDKYYWAIKMGIPVVRPHWLYQIRDKWQTAEPIDFDALLQEHRLDAFEGLTMAMAGVTDVNKRKEIRDQIKLASGTTPTVFKLDGSFTHLLCQDVKDSTTHKAVERFLHKANRYRKRREDVPADAPDAQQMRAALDLKMVWIEWLEDCIAVNGCIEERLYAIGEPRMNKAQRERLVNSILAKQAGRKTYTAERMQACRTANADVNPDERDAAKENESERAKVSRPATKRAKGGLSELVQHLTSDRLASTSIVAEASPMPEQSVDEKVVADAAPIASRKKASASHKDTDEKRSVDVPEADSQSGLFDQSLEKNLKDLVFRIDLRDESKNDRVREALKAYGIKHLLSADDTQHADYHVLPLGRVDVVGERRHLGQPITHFFIERCMIEGRALKLDESFALTPAAQAFPLKGCEKLRIALTGLGSNEDGPDRHQVELALDTAGIKAESVLNRNLSTHLLVGKAGAQCGNAQAKVAKAKLWGIPIIGTEFVNHLFRQGLEKALSSIDYSSATNIAKGDKSDLRRTEQEESRSETMSTDSVRRPLHDRKVSTTWQRSSSDGEKVFGNVSRPVVPSPDSRKQGSEPPNDHRAQQRVDAQQREILDTHPTNGSASKHMMDLLAYKGRDEIGDDTSTSSVGMGRAQNASSTGRKTKRLAPSARNRASRTSRTPTREERAPSMASDLSDVSNIFNGGADERGGIGQDINALMMQQSMLNPYTTLSPADAPTEESLRVVYDDPIARRERRKLAALLGSNRKNNDDDASQSDSSPQKADQENGNRHGQHITTRSEGLTKVRSADFTPSIKARRQPGTAQRDV